jgi:hypothetical protein
MILIPLLSLLFVGGAYIRMYRAKRLRKLQAQAKIDGSIFDAPRYDPSLLDSSLSLKDIFRCRLIHALLILMSIIYFKITTLSFAGINCIRSINDGQLYLYSEQATTKCYTGTHLFTAIMIYIIMIVYIIGFPLVCLRLLHQAFVLDNLKTAVQQYVGPVIKTHDETDSVKQKNIRLTNLLFGIRKSVINTNKGANAGTNNIGAAGNDGVTDNNSTTVTDNHHNSDSVGSSVELVPITGDDNNETMKHNADDFASALNMYREQREMKDLLLMMRKDTFGYLFR